MDLSIGFFTIERYRVIGDSDHSRRVGSAAVRAVVDNVLAGLASPCPAGGSAVRLVDGAGYDGLSAAL